MATETEEPTDFVVIGGVSDTEKFDELVKLSYKEQAVTFLNAFWKTGPAFEEHPELAESLWEYVGICEKLDVRRGSEGSCLDEFCAHRLLEKIGDALTVRKMRAALKDAGLNFHKSMSLTDILVYRFEAD